MQESDNEIRLSRQKTMLSSFDAVSKVVANLCDVNQSEIISKKKDSPLPICRGICWYAIRVAFDATYTELSKLSEILGCKYTSAGIGFSVGQAINLSIRSPHWSRVWNQVKSTLPSKKDVDKTILIQIIIPKGSKENIKFEIKEKND